MTGEWRSDTRGDHERGFTEPVRHPDVEVPRAVLGYGSGESASSGFAAGVDTSEDRARTEDSIGVTGRRQGIVLDRLAWRREKGATWKDLADDYGWHHGQASSVLSNLHKAGRIARLTETRNRCHVYVLPEYVNGRETQAQGRPRQPEDGTAAALVTAEAAIARVRALHGVTPEGKCRECWTLVGDPFHPYPARPEWPCATLRALDGEDTAP